MIDCVPQLKNTKVKKTMFFLGARKEVKVLREAQHVSIENTVVAVGIPATPECEYPKHPWSENHSTAELLNAVLRTLAPYMTQNESPSQNSDDESVDVFELNGQSLL